MIKLKKDTYQMYCKRQLALQKKKLYLKSLKEKVNNYVNNILQLQYTAKIGLVFNRFEEYLEKYGTFTIYIDKGYTITHKDIKLCDINL